MNMKITQVHDQYVLGLLDDSPLSEDSVPSNYFKLGQQFWQYVRSKKKDRVSFPTLKVGTRSISEDCEKADVLKDGAH